MDIDNMATQFKELADLQAYSHAQYQTIISLSKKLHTLEEENVHLKKLLDNSTQLTKDPASQIEIYLNFSDEEAICRMELKKLKTLAIERDLSLEEAKRTEIYTKLLLNMDERKTKDVTPNAPLDNAQLLAMLGDNSINDQAQ